MSDRDGVRARWARRGAEGLTIVLSILLALAAEAAWGYRADRAEEARLLEALDVEFADAFDEVASDLGERRRMLDRLALAPGVRAGGSLPSDSAAVIVSALLDWRFYTPAHAVLDDAISSGRLNLILSEEIRRALMAYQRERGRIEVFDARERNIVSELVEPYLVERIALDRLLGSPASPTEGERFLSLLESDDTLVGLVALKRQRTDETVIFSTVVQRRILDVLDALAEDR